MRILVCGLGVTGGTLYKWLEKHTTNELFKHDPPKGFVYDFANSPKPDAVFICVPVPTSKEGTLDYSILKPLLKEFRQPKFDRLPIYIRSTLLPKATDHLVKFLKLRLYSMPEFLTERNAYESMCEQDIICGVENNADLQLEQLTRLKGIFPGKKITLMSNRECELAKYAHNVLGTLKVNFCNLVSKYSEVIGCDYENVLSGMLMSKYINKTCTQVPGPDGKYGFGGACYPKDLIAFTHEAKRLGLQVGSLECVLFENSHYRLARDKWLKQPHIDFDHSYNPTY